MQENRDKYNIDNKAIGWLFTLALCFGWLSAYTGSVVISFAVSAACFSCLLASVNDRKMHALLFALLSALLLLPSVFFGLSYLSCAVSLILVSALIGYGYSFRMIKPDVVLFVTLALSFCLVGIGYAWIGSIAGSFAKEAVGETLSLFIGNLENAFEASFNQPEYASIHEYYGDDFVSSIIDTLFRLSIAGVVILAFFICGITLKLFAFIRKRVCKEDEYIQIWRFTVPPSFAYFFCLLFFVQLFIVDLESTFSVVLMNLYLIFLVVFAYIGFRFLLFTIQRRKNRKGLFYLLLFASVLFFSSIAIRIIALNGVLAVIVANRLSDHYTGDM